MERLSIIFKSIISAGGAIASYAFGGWSFMLEFLLIVVVIDYLVGFTAAAIEGKLNSEIGFRGIAKKVLIFFVVMIAHKIDLALGDGNLLRDATIFFYLANELLSIIENVGRVGVPIPDTIRKAVEVLKGKGESGQ